MDPRNGESPQSDLGRKRMQRKVGDHSRRCGLVRGTKAQSQNEQYMQETLGAGGTRNWDGRRVGKAPSVDPVSGNEANTKVKYDGEMARSSNQPQ